MELRRFFCIILLLCAAQAGSAQVQPAHTALWHNDTRTGEGWLLEVLDEELAVLYWFTYDEEGRQRWLMDVGRISGDTITFSELLDTRGGRLGATDQREVEARVVGQAVMTFDDCDSGTFEYSAFGHSESIDITPLTATSGAACGVSGSEPSNPNAALTGSWYDAEHSGEGFILQWMSRDQALLIWFTYDNDGGQKWILGTGATRNGYIEFKDLNTTYGASFGPEFDRDDVVQEVWGDLRILLNPAGGRVEYFPQAERYGAGEMTLVPLTEPDWVGAWWRPPVARGTEAFDITAFSVRGNRGSVLDTSATGEFYLNWTSTDGTGLVTRMYHIEAWLVSGGGENVWQKHKILGRNCPAYIVNSGCDFGNNSFPCRFVREGGRVNMRCPADEKFGETRVDHFFDRSIGLPGQYFIQVEACGYALDPDLPYIPAKVCGSRSAPVWIE